MWPLAKCISSTFVQTPSLQLGVLQSLWGSFLLRPVLLSHLALSLIPLVEARAKTYKSVTIYHMAQVRHKGVNPFTDHLMLQCVKKQPSQDVLHGDAAEEELGLACLVSSYTLPHQNSQPGRRGRQTACSKVLSRRARDTWSVTWRTSRPYKLV